MKYVDLVRAAAKVVGVTHELTDDDAGYILWEYTGFPEFFEYPNHLRVQLLEFMRTWRDTGKWPKHWLDLEAGSPSD